jgi:hypothetical protein
MRDRISVGALRQRFLSHLEENEWKCPNCNKNLQSMCDRTRMNHAYKKCVPSNDENQENEENGESDEPEFGAVLDNNVNVTTAPDISNPSDVDDGEDVEGGGQHDEEEDLDVWEGSFLDASKEVQIGGQKRQTAAQVRENLKVEIQGQSVGSILHRISSINTNIKVKDEILDVIKAVVPPSKRKLIPNSWHILRRAMKVKDLSAVEIQICPSCWGHAWKPCKKEDWPRHSQECDCAECTCPQCGEGKRFVCQQSTWKASACCYYMGLQHQISTKFQMKDFRDSLKKGKRYDTPGSWYNSKHSRWINGQTGGAANENNDLSISDFPGEAFKQGNSIYSIHFDWVQIKTSKRRSHSVGMMILRNDSVAEEEINNDRWAMPIMVIPGPKEPGSLQIHWKILGDEFSRYERDGMVINFVEEGNVVQVIHRPFLARFICDAAARPKILFHNGAMASSPCPWCDFHSSGNGKVYGYCSPIEYTDYDFEEMLEYAGTGEYSSDRKKSVQIGVTHPSGYKRTKSDIEKIYSIVERANTKYCKKIISKLRLSQIRRETGFKDRSEILLRPDLKAVHPIHAVQVPIYHCLLLGLVSDFLKHIFLELNVENSSWDILKPDQEGVKKLATAPDWIIRSCDQTDRCIDTRIWSGFLVSSLLTFVEVYSCFLFNEEVCGFKTLSETASKAWGLLRKGVLYFIRDERSTFDDLEQSRSNAVQNLLDYAKICEEHMPSLCTQNMHIALCRLPDQEEFCGRANITHDLYMERNIRMVKEYEKSYRQNHEVSFVKRVLEKSVTPWLSQHMGESLSHDPTREEEDCDCPLAGDVACMIGKGSIYEPPFEANIILDRCLEALPEGTEGLDYSHWQVLSHSSAFLQQFNRVERIISMQNNKETLKFSKIVVVHYNGEERLALVRNLWRVTHLGQTRARGAIVDIFHKAESIKSEEFGNIYRYRKFWTDMMSLKPCDFIQEDFEETSVMLNLEEIRGKVCLFIRPDDRGQQTSSQDGFYWVYCATSKSRSGVGRL